MKKGKQPINADENLSIKIENMHKAFIESALSTPGLFLNYDKMDMKLSKKVDDINEVFNVNSEMVKVKKYTGNDAIALSYAALKSLNESKTILPNSICEAGLQDAVLAEWGNGEFVNSFAFVSTLIRWVLFFDER